MVCVHFKCVGGSKLSAKLTRAAAEAEAEREQVGDRLALRGPRGRATIQVANMCSGFSKIHPNVRSMTHRHGKRCQGSWTSDEAGPIYLN
jgi:hypothetical protein